MGVEKVHVSGYYDGTMQEIRASILGGGPGGLEVIIQSSRSGFDVKFWHPYNHEWVILGDALKYCGNTLFTPVVPAQNIKPVPDYEDQQRNRVTHVHIKKVCNDNLDQCEDCGAAESELYDYTCTKFKALHPDRET